MYTNTFKNELTTDQKRKLLLNTCGIYLLSQWRKEYSFKTYANCTGFIIMFLLCLILFLKSQSTIFQLCRDGSSWVEPVLSYDYCFTQGHNTVTPERPEIRTLTLLDSCAFN